MRAPDDPAAALAAILKSHDRIGFGRRGVLDAEEEICRFAVGLSPEARARMSDLVLSWLDAAAAERATAALHYNLPEHVQALAIHLCAALPIPDSAPLLQRLQASGAFDADETPLRREALHDALADLAALADATPD